ncbi:MAG TPA: helix-turn-helix domain-containing protein, partial [Kineosporiaceae bacterium]|nr:helix-turn-helix domain-containing protein [Kineosporiaceae bacterium]
MITRSATGAIDPVTIANRQEFAAALTALREDAGLTVRQVARAAAINPSTAGGYFSGRHLPPLRPQGSIRAILAVCGITDPALVAAWEHTLARVRRPPGPRPIAVPAPYRGLARYGSHDADWFFGRDDETRRLHRQLDEAHRDGGLVVVLGTAGSGKSSLLAAGLLPELSRGLVVHPVATVTPGADPLRALATALASLANTDPVEVLADLRSTPNAARDLARRAVPPRDRVIVLPWDGEPVAARELEEQEQQGAQPPPDQRTDAGPTPYPVIVVDQLEELFVQCRDAAAQKAFIAALASLSRPGRDGDPAVAVVVTAARSGSPPGTAPA